MLGGGLLFDSNRQFPVTPSPGYSEARNRSRLRITFLSLVVVPMVVVLMVPVMMFFVPVMMVPVTIIVPVMMVFVLVTIIIVILAACSALSREGAGSVDVGASQGHGDARQDTSD
jgi:uncharacterized membrane protein